MVNTVEQPDRKHGDLTQKIIACAMTISTDLGSGFLETVYEQALLWALSDAGLDCERQKPIPVSYRNRIIGMYYADLVVEGCVIVELKAARAWVPEHEAQVIHYLAATGLEVGLLLNFGKPRLEYRRLARYRDLDEPS